MDHHQRPIGERTPRWIDVAGLRFHVAAVVFDKDGTLVDLDATWSHAGQVIIDAVAGDDIEVRGTLDQALGYDRRAQRLVHDGVLAAGTLGQLEAVVRTTLDRCGVAEHNPAVGLAIEAGRRAAISTPPKPIGDVRESLTRLFEAGIALGVVTSDDRALAQSDLGALGVAHLVSSIVGGDDVLSPKPAPDGIVRVLRELGVSPGEAIVVGDSSVDVAAGRSAGIAGVVAVGRHSAAAQAADVVVDDVSQLMIAD